MRTHGSQKRQRLFLTYCLLEGFFRIVPSLFLTVTSIYA
jgi:hypothetical protein